MSKAIEQGQIFLFDYGKDDDRVVEGPFVSLRPIDQAVVIGQYLKWADRIWLTEHIRVGWTEFGNYLRDEGYAANTSRSLWRLESEEEE